MSTQKKRKTTRTRRVAPPSVTNALAIPELLDHILAHVELKKSDLNYSPQHALLPSLFVSKLWHAVAERRFYRAIRIGDESSDPELLCEILEETPRLAALVTELRLGAMYHEQGETQTIIELLELCPNVKHVWVDGYYTEELDAYRAALRWKVDLVSLVVNKFGLMERGNYEGAGFCTATDLVSMLAGWPKLESLRLQNRALLYNWENEEDEAAVQALGLVPGCCPSLRQVESKESIPWRNYHLKALATMAPHLQDLTLSLNSPFTSDTLNECLRLWAPTLQRLHLDDYRVDNMHIDDAFPHLQNLTWLRTSSKVLRPSSFKGSSSSPSNPAPKLRTLQYLVKTPEELEELVDGMKVAETLPALHLLKFAWLEEAGGPDDALRDVCASRGVVFESHRYGAWESMNPEVLFM
ncbi:hypothetical protein PLICRDRAFT_51970 [Plicaturopsis crispa FD-325 SS-3]|nr:hypothetical protein PLICRDRAFT_51970 [Plicaturopsis crispa FD-325 SS-3]